MWSKRVCDPLNFDAGLVEPVVAEACAAYDAAGRHVSLAELERGDCRFPVGASDAAVGRHLFCGHPAAPGSPYCAHHAERSVGEGTRGEQAAAKTLEVLGRARAA